MPTLNWVGKEKVISKALETLRFLKGEKVYEE